MFGSKAALMPTVAMDERSKDYAITCAVPVDDPGGDPV